MINKIVLSNIATFKSQEIKTSEVNYFYGNNGSGKTTISKLISNMDLYPECSIEWKNENKLETLVYNKDFIEGNLKRCDSIKGIFTLGKDTKEAREFIENAKKEIDENSKQQNALKQSLENLREKINNEKESILDICWGQRKVVGDIFNKALIGSLKRELFMEKCMNEINNNSQLLDIDSLKKRYDIVYNSEIKKYDIINNFEYSEIMKLEKSEILKKSITGKEDLQIGRLIQKLNNSDWVKQGLNFSKESDDKCPFCQQVVNPQLLKTIDDFFDETYEEECNNIKMIYKQYKIFMDIIVNLLKSIILLNIEIIDNQKLEKQVINLEEIYKENMSKMEEKIKSPSLIVELVMTENLFEEINNTINSFNESIIANNTAVDNISTEQEKIKSLIWKYIVSNVKTNLDKYINENKKIIEAERTILEKIKVYRDKNSVLDNNIKIKEAEVTSVVHTVNEINRILKNFGFTGFKLKEAEGLGTYRIVRNDGTDVKETLSEGEYNFISFLYFYQLIKGSIESSGTIKDKIIVIDDPISSLDSNVLFIVSTLVKSIIGDCFNKVNGIKQVFVLTHNVYFHKEITYKSRGGKRKEESYWIVQKNNDISIITAYDENPIKTTYELLWRELDDLTKPSKPTIFNTLRRILEYYFNTIGGENYEDYESKFEDNEKIIFKSLISCINDNSHFISDDFSMSVGSDSIVKYVEVFKKIFDVTGHINHYNMMMRIKE